MGSNKVGLSADELDAPEFILGVFTLCTMRKVWCPTGGVILMS